MKIALIGDSISKGYGPFVAELLPEHEVFVPAENCGDSRAHLEHFEQWYAAPRVDTIQLNCGLHDLRFGLKDGRHQIEPDAYRRNLTELAARLGRLEGVTVIWAATTPVIESRFNLPERTVHRFDRDVDRYNDIAREVMTVAGFAINDLNAFVREAGVESVISGDGVHMTEDGRKRTAGQIVGFLRPFLRA